MKILYSSNELHDAISLVLSGPAKKDRRVALVAYVGAEAQSYLPDPNDLEIVCCLKPGSTDPLALLQLRDRGAKIFKSDRLHMKVYWSERNGCVICSANASGNAFGRHSQKEAGVFLPRGAVDINRLRKYCAPKIVEDTDLKKLTREAERLPRSIFYGAQQPEPSFLDWRNNQLSSWKLGWWTDNANFAKEARYLSKKRYGVEPHEFMNISFNQLRAGDWVLSFKLNNGSFIKWLYVDFVVKIEKTYPNYEREYPYQAVQVKQPRLCPRPPFKIDSDFKLSFKNALAKFGQERVEQIHSLKPPKAFIDLIAATLR